MCLNFWKDWEALKIDPCKKYCQEKHPYKTCWNWCRNKTEWTEQSYKKLVDSTLKYLY